MYTPSFRRILLVLAIAIPVAVSAQYNYYFGNLHAHTSYSDGCKDSEETGVKTPAQCYTFAKASDHFDFLGISEHNHSQAGMQYANFAKGVSQAKNANLDNFASLYGMEYGVISQGGHVLIYGIDSLIGWEANNYDLYCPKSDYNKLWKLLAKYPRAFATLAHPENDHFSKLITMPYNKWADAAICGVAINTGPAFATNTDYTGTPAKRFYSYYQRLLAKGYKLGPTIDHDNHNLTFGRMAGSRTVVLASELTPDGISEAYKAMRFYASDDYNAKVSFTIDDNPMGSSIKAANENIGISVSVDDDDHEAVRSIRVLYAIPGSGEVATQLTAVRNGTRLSYTDTIKKGESYYYYAEIVQADGDRIVTSPIWVKR
jgi:hypothetical protein